MISTRVHRIELFGFPIFVHNTACWKMDDIVDLGETVECPSTQVSSVVHCDTPEEFFDGDEPALFTPATGRRGGRGTRRNLVHFNPPFD